MFIYNKLPYSIKVNQIIKPILKLIIQQNKCRYERIQSNVIIIQFKCWVQGLHTILYDYVLFTNKNYNTLLYSILYLLLPSSFTISVRYLMICVSSTEASTFGSRPILRVKQ